MLTQQLQIFALPKPWYTSDTEKFLTHCPLPKNFKWRLTKKSADAEFGDLVDVQPAHKDRDYGTWLRNTPYFQGLFEKAHTVIAEYWAEHADLPTSEYVAERLTRHRLDQERPTFPTPIGGF